MLNDLLLLSGNDIPFLAGQVNIHQPTLKEIAYIGEESFFIGCQLLNFSKDMLNTEDNSSLENMSNFEILMSIAKDKNVSTRKQINNMIMVLALLFPEHEINLSNKSILLLRKNLEGQVIELGQINNENFEEFKKIISAMFCLENMGGNEEAPQGELAKKIAKKLQERKRKLAELKGEQGQKISIFSRYISILTVGENKDMNSLLQLTVYQLFDEFQRYELKLNFDYHLQATMAGAKDLKDVDDWMKDIHS